MSRPVGGGGSAADGRGGASLRFITALLFAALIYSPAHSARGSVTPATREFGDGRTCTAHEKTNTDEIN